VIATFGLSRQVIPASLNEFRTFYNTAAVSSGLRKPVITILPDEKMSAADFGFCI
jgi:hypothetical protein